MNRADLATRAQMRRARKVLERYAGVGASRGGAGRSVSRRLRASKSYDPAWTARRAEPAEACSSGLVPGREAPELPRAPRRTEETRRPPAGKEGGVPGKARGSRGSRPRRGCGRKRDGQAQTLAEHHRGTNHKLPRQVQVSPLCCGDCRAEKSGGQGPEEAGAGEGSRSSPSYGCSEKPSLKM